MSESRWSFFVSAMLAATVAATHATEPPLATVGEVDATRYAGLWYEVANYPNRFQRVCVRNTTAEYTVRDDGTLRVVNRCATSDGMSSVDGLARRVGAGADKLEVSFLPPAVRWLPSGWGDYWVIGLAPDYRYAVVGEPSRKYLWVLSRTPKLAAEDRRAIDALLRERGYDPARLVATAQEPAKWHASSALPIRRAASARRRRPRRRAQSACRTGARAEPRSAWKRQVRQFRLQG